MEIKVEDVQVKAPVTILSLKGELDASNFELLIEQAKSCHAAGSRNFLIDMSELNFMSSSGLVALHSIVLITRGEQPPEMSSGWSVFHSIELDMDSGIQVHVKILNPQPKIHQTLKKTGMDHFFMVFTDRQAAIQSFN